MPTSPKSERWRLRLEAGELRVRTRSRTHANERVLGGEGKRERERREWACVACSMLPHLLHCTLLHPASLSLLLAAAHCLQLPTEEEAAAGEAEEEEEATDLAE